MKGEITEWVDLQVEKPGLMRRRQLRLLGQVRPFLPRYQGKIFFVRGSLGEQAIHDNFAAWINVSRAGKIDGPAAREHLLRATILMQR